MATPKEYAYYIKGSYIYIVQKDTGFINDPNSRDYGAEVNWKSPLSAVTDGLELVYTYTPWYRLLRGNHVSGLSTITHWMVDESDGTVKFVDGESAYTNFDTGYDVGDYFYLRNAEQHNGIHKIKGFADISGTNNVITTHTAINTGLSNITSVALPDLLAYSVVDVMEDESYDIPMSDYLCKAIVYYLKAKQLEDAMEIEGSEYFMRKFRKQVEKNASNKATGHRKIQGFWGMR